MVETGERFAIPSVVLHEFLFGIAIIKRAEQNLQEWESIGGRFDIYNIDGEIAQQAAMLRVQLRKQGWQLGGIDSMVAIIAVRNQLTLLTTDKDFQGVPDLKLENWYVIESE